MIRELARRGALDRPVSRVVRAQRDLVHEETAVAHEELDRQHAERVHQIGDLSPESIRLVRRRLVDLGGVAGLDAHPLGLHRRDEGIARVTLEAAHDDERHLTAQIQSFLDHDARRGTEFVDQRECLDATLRKEHAASVVAAARGLQYRRADTVEEALQHRDRTLTSRR